MIFDLKMAGYCCNLRHLDYKRDDSLHMGALRPAVSKSDEFYIENEEFCIKNDAFCRAINYPLLWITLTAIENSFLQVKWIALMQQLTMMMMLASSLALHILYIANVSTLSTLLQLYHIMHIVTQAHSLLLCSYIS